MVEVAKRLSSMFGSGDVQMLEFEDDKLLVTESAKGFTVIALVSKAEEHLESLIRVIAEDLDESDIQQPNGAVNPTLMKQVDVILERYLENQIDVELHDVLSSTWEPILGAVKQNNRLAKLVKAADQMLLAAGRDGQSQWLKFDRKMKGTVKEALDFAFTGAFDSACAVAMDTEVLLPQLFAIKTGLLALSMTRTRAPPLSVLKSVAETLPDSSDPFTELAKAAVQFRDQRLSSEEYVKLFRKATEQFQFGNDDEHLLQAFLFIDPAIKDVPEFAAQLIQYFKTRSAVISTYLTTLLEQSKISQFHTMVSYDQFKDALGVWRTKIKDTLDRVALAVRPGLFQLQYLRRETEQRELSITESLNVQIFLALNTALAKSSVLTLSERKEILSEVIRIYTEYFRKLLKSQTPLFSQTIQSVFQSISVAMAEYFLLITGQEKAQHLGHMTEFLRDVVMVLTEEWVKRQVNTTPLFAVTNALCPIFSMAEQLHDEELQLTYLALRMMDTKSIDNERSVDPQGYAMIVGSLLNTFAALAMKTLEEKMKTTVLQKCVESLIHIHKFFLSHCIVCRDDVITATFLVGQMIDDLPTNKLEPLIKAVLALNRVAVPSLEKHGYEAAVIGGPLINLLMKSSKLLGSNGYHRHSKLLYDAAITAWRKYGFPDKATEFEETYTPFLKPPA